MESNQERNSTYEVRYRAKVAEGAVGEQGNTDNNTHNKKTQVNFYWMEAMPQE